jgi:hypothetical protein
MSIIIVFLVCFILFLISFTVDCIVDIYFMCQDRKYYEELTKDD